MNARGQTTIEYVLVAVLIAVAIVLAFREAEVDRAVSIAAGNINSSLVVDE